MAKLTDEEEFNTNSVILFGAPFTGKTTLAGMLAEHFKLIYVDLEKGRRALTKLPVEFKAHVEVIKLPDTPSYPIAIETCLKMVKGPVDICEAHGKVGCSLCKKADAAFNHVDLNSLGPEYVVIFDSATQLTASAIAHITKNQPEGYKLQRDDWGNLSTLMHKWFGYIQNAPYNVIVISHVSESEQEDGKMMLTPVAGSSTFSANVAKYFDHSVYAEIKNKTHRFASSTSYNTRIKTGSRTDIKLEDDPAASLLSIFKPELLGEGKAAPDKKKLLSTSSSVAAGSGKLADVLTKAREQAEGVK